MRYEDLLLRLREDFPQATQGASPEWHFWIYLAVFVLLAVGLCFWLWTCVVIVRQKTAAIIEVFGKFNSVKQAGLNFKMPWPVASVADIVDLQIVELGENVSIKSLDNVFLILPVKAQVQVMTDKIKESYYELDNPYQQMKSYIANIVRSHATSMTMEDIFKGKDSFEDIIENALAEKFSSYGYKVVNTLVDDPKPSGEIIEAFNRVLASQREKEAAKNEAEATKIKMIGEAEAEGESLKIKGEAFKNFRSAIAEGNAEAIQSFLEGCEGLTAKDVLEFFAGVDVREAIRDASKGNGSVVVVPLDMNSKFINEIAANVAVK